MLAFTGPGSESICCCSCSMQEPETAHALSQDLSWMYLYVFVRLSVAAATYCSRPRHFAMHLFSLIALAVSLFAVHSMRPGANSSAVYPNHSRGLFRPMPSPYFSAWLRAIAVDVSLCFFPSRTLPDVAWPCALAIQPRDIDARKFGILLFRISVFDVVDCSGNDAVRVRPLPCTSAASRKKGTACFAANIFW